MINDALKRKLIRAGNTCIKVATEGKGKSMGGLYKTSSKEYIKAAKHRDTILKEIQEKYHKIIRPSLKSTKA